MWINKAVWDALTIGEKMSALEYAAHQSRKRWAR